MAGTTNFQQWNPGIENQQTDAEYTADTQRSGGAVAGVFPSTTANKLFFQLSSMVTALATMMANKGYTVEDGSAGTSGHNFAALVAVLTNLVTAVDQQKCKFVYVAGGGTVNDYTAIYSPAVPALTDGLLLGFKAANTNTGHSIFCPQGLTAKPIYGLGHVFLQGGEIVANSAVWVMYNASLNSGSGGWVLLNASGGGLQVANPTQSYHALNRLTGDARYQPLDSDLTAIAAIVGQRGDIIYYGPSGWTRLGKGTSGQFLSIGANDPAWATLNFLSSFGASIGDSGYQYFPSGLLVQWGAVSMGASTSKDVSFPIAWPNVCWIMVGVQPINTGNQMAVSPISKSQFHVNSQNTNNTLQWMAVGY